MKVSSLHSSSGYGKKHVDSKYHFSQAGKTRLSASNSFKLCEKSTSNQHKKYGFTLVEIMIGILIVSIVMIGGFQALSSVMIGKSRLIEQANIQKESFYFTEKLFEMIKSGGTLDYEEYFNRSVVGTATFSGSYTTPSGFGNYGNTGNIGTSTYGDGFYLCRSGNATVMTGNGCVSSFNGGFNYTGQPQRYGQYSYQFLDYNNNADADGGDEDGNGSIVGDDDDRYLGEGPVVFGLGNNIHELYLISPDLTTRTYFRWKVRLDPNAPATQSCINTTGSGCLGTIEFLKLQGRDIGLDHDDTTLDSTQYDGVVDTWYIDPQFTGGQAILAGSGGIDAYWQPLFPDSVHVSDFSVTAYPNTDASLAWKQSGVDLAPYVQLQFRLLPSWHTRKVLKGTPQELQFSTTLTLSSALSR
ncbi:prepilin-type N-terminal cleavage/methylation domain-containing protein [Candidatus Gracilibacteria bacterium]|nr:prepilin-type N-terminal cleavage/methylation domain-containing protein [Candidatus Gracilibacteria bacterium]